MCYQKDLCYARRDRSFLAIDKIVSRLSDITSPNVVLHNFRELVRVCVAERARPTAAVLTLRQTWNCITK